MTLEPHTDPLSPDNILIFSTSVMTGAPVPGAAILSVISKSPLTGGIHESPTPGYMGEQIKKACYDIIIIKGKSNSPVLLLINDNSVDFIDAGDLWGLDTAETIDRTKKADVGAASVCSIGITGENLVKYASIVHNCLFNTSRGGLGAVMGSRLIKAIAVHGTGAVSVYDSRKLQKYSERFRKNFLDNPINKR